MKSAVRVIPIMARHYSRAAITDTRAGGFVLRRQSRPEMGHGDLFLRAHGGRDLCPGSALDTLF
jgi:hypothetical protein